MSANPDDGAIRLRDMGKRDASIGMYPRPESSIVKALGSRGIAMPDKEFESLKTAYNEGYATKESE